EEAPAESPGVDQAENDRAQEQEARGVDQVEMGLGQAADRQLVDLLEALEQHERAAEREREEEREEPPGRGAEGQRAEPLEPAEIDLAAAMAAVERRGQGAVSLEELIAAQESRRRSHVAELQVAPRGGIAEVAQVREAARDDRVEQLLDELAIGHAF